jgi:hypothetical protein
MRGAPTRDASMRGAVASNVGVASRGVASGCCTRAASLLKIRIGSRGAVRFSVVPAQPTLAAAKTATATNKMGRSSVMAEPA